jgi:DNA-directed RNA polymerase subunit RPC12/RpoP
MPRNKAKISDYGTCWECQSPVEIPGVDAFKCPQCGWKKATQKTVYKESNNSQRRSRIKNTEGDPLTLFV